MLLHIAAAAALILFSAQGCARASDTAELFGPTAPDEYLTGRFAPEKHPLFVKLSDLGIPCDRPHYLRREAAQALGKLYQALKSDHPKVKFWVQSSTRNFDSQRWIWERRWDEYVKQYPKKNGEEIASLILRYSSMPSTSRHHWGTDFDINVLSNEYYEKGDGALLYCWLGENAARFGFCQPYTAGRKSGYNEERWHWSYLPLSGEFRRQWNERFGDNPAVKLKSVKFTGSQSAIPMAPLYVNGVSERCVQ